MRFAALIARPGEWGMLDAHRSSRMTSGTSTTPSGELAALLADLDAAASTLDSARFVAFLYESPGFAWTFNGRMATTVAEVRDWHHASWSRLANARFVTGEPRVAMIGADRAILTASGHSERTTRDGEQTSGDYAITLYVVRTATGWRIVQGHESTVR
jgi:SnoaL-like domain